MLQEIVAKKRYVFAKGFDSWQEAIAASYQPLLDQGVVNETYIDAVIANVVKYGPYIVLIPGVAMPHSTQGAEGAFETAVTFMHVENEVDFDPEDPDKKATIFFSLSAVDADAHLVNMAALMETLTNEEALEALLNCKDVDELKRIADQFPPTEG